VEEILLSLMLIQFPISTGKRGGKPRRGERNGLQRRAKKRRGITGIAAPRPPATGQGYTGDGRTKAQKEEGASRKGRIYLDYVRTKQDKA